MTTLNPESDRSVREAVDAYLDGTFRPELSHDTRFETRNGHYRLVGGVLSHVVRGTNSDVAHIGAELVGWLWEGHSGSRVDAAWRSGARGVLVDRRRGRHIVITSATRNLVSEMLTGSQPPYTGSPDPHLGGSIDVLAAVAPVPVINYSPEVYSPEVATGGAPDPRWADPPQRQDAVTSAPWNLMTPATPSEPIQVATPRFAAPGASGAAEMYRSAIAAPPQMGELGLTNRTVPRAPPYPHDRRPLPLPIPPPRRLDAPPAEQPAIYPHGSVTQRSAMPAAEANHVNQIPAAPPLVTPRPSAPAAARSAPEPGTAGLGARPDGSPEAEENVATTVPGTPQPVAARRPTSAHVQRGMLLR